MSVQTRTIQEIYDYFKSNGCILLEDYCNATKKMYYICGCGRKSEINWNHFSKGKRCGYCSKSGRKKKYSLEEVKEIFLNRGCVILQDFYKNKSDPIFYRCVCGNEARISLDAFKNQKQNCILCAAMKRSGSKNHHWRFDRDAKDRESLLRDKCHNLINRLLSRLNTEKENKINGTLKYSAIQLFKSMESHPDFELFKKNMVVDHIFPIQAFIDVGILEVRLINSIDNLKPSNRNLNSAKGSKYDMSDFLDWLNEKGYSPDVIAESTSSNRYSVEVNFRTTVEEVAEGFAKIALGYVSAGLKQHNFHVKHVYGEEPIRILVSSRNWDDGEWICAVSWNAAHKCFVVSKGFYNKDRKTVSIQSSEKCKGENAFEIMKQVYNTMHDLKGKPDRHMEKLKPVPLKRGPKS